MSILDMLFWGFISAVVVVIYRVIKSRRQARERGLMAKEDIVQARKFMIEELNHCIQDGEVIGASEIKGMIKSVKEYHPDVQIDFDLVAGTFEIELKCFKEKRTIFGYSVPPKYELENNLIYRIK